MRLKIHASKELKIGEIKFTYMKQSVKSATWVLLMELKKKDTKLLHDYASSWSTGQGVNS